MSIPDPIRRAIEAQGRVDPTEVERAIAGTGDAVIPADEEEVERQERHARLARAKHTGLQCCECDGIADPHDPNTLREVRGWARPREQGGQNHVIARQETGRVMCGRCALRLRAGLAPEQASLPVE